MYYKKRREHAHMHYRINLYTFGMHTKQNTPPCAHTTDAQLNVSKAEQTHHFEMHNKIYTISTSMRWAV